MENLFKHLFLLLPLMLNTSSVYRLCFYGQQQSWTCLCLKLLFVHSVTFSTSEQGECKTCRNACLIVLNLQHFRKHIDLISRSALIHTCTDISPLFLSSSLWPQLFLSHSVFVNGNLKINSGEQQCDVCSPACSSTLVSQCTSRHHQTQHHPVLLWRHLWFTLRASCLTAHLSYRTVLLGNDLSDIGTGCWDWLTNRVEHVSFVTHQHV